MDQYDDFFQTITGGIQPHAWQTELAANPLCVNRTIRIVTGFGKTFGALGAWTWHRVLKNDNAWPRRLVWCLPMRVLVEQTEQEVRAALAKMGRLWDGGDHAGKVGVHLLMGGANSGQWHLYPEHCAVLIGTQDMLLSRALNRGYACSRARWPMEFGLLHQDALWVLDEVQLMDVGLATSAQIQAFRDDDAAQSRAVRPCRTWWMSATLQPEWLAKSPDTVRLTADLPSLSIAPEMRVGRLWEDVRKPCSREQVASAKDITALIAREHLALDRNQSGPTLVVMNTVKTAVEVFKELNKITDLSDTDIRLVHSRFRPRERALWRDAFLNKSACAAGTNRIIVATQVVEAGVDLSASLLLTELAIWASLVQRFGRAARWGGVARIIVVDLAAGLGQQAREKAAKSGKKDVDLDAKAEEAESKAALPYALEEVRAAREALALLDDVSPKSLEVFEETHPELLYGLYPYEPKHLLLRHEMDELFDTSPDLSGADIDISRFIRSGDERDVQIFWETVATGEEPAVDLRPAREAQCSVPFLAAREWLCGKSQRLQAGKRAWVWDWVEGVWRRAESRDFYPGQTILVATDCGGYNPTLGWDSGSTRPVEPVSAQQTAEDRAMDLADAAQDSEALSHAAWQTIAFHCGQAAKILNSMTGLVPPDLEKPVGLAGRFHDVGKALYRFQGRIKIETGQKGQGRTDWERRSRSKRGIAMPCIIMRFPGRRYHATPWGHHVNEGLVEWPPSPWRLIRALLSVGYTKGIWNGDGPLETARNLIAKLSGTLPEYSLPGAVGAHSRHYMPTSRLKSGNEDKTLVFDTWARVDDGELVLFWDVALEQDEQLLLTELVARLGYLGRAESWVEARLARADEQVPQINCRPDDTPPLPGWEQVALIAPQAEADYAAWRQAAEESIHAKLPPLDDTKKITKAQREKLTQQRTKALEPYPLDLLDALQKDTAWWRGHGWSQPPGSRRVFYQRPKDALVVGTPSARAIPSSPPVRAMLLALATSTGNKQALPPVTMTLYQGERLHKRLVGLAEGYNRALSGCDENGAPLAGKHDHAHILALDLDADDHLDHFLIWVPMGLDGAAQKAVRALRKTYAKGVKELRLALAASTPDLDGLHDLHGEHGERLRALLGLEGAAEWVSQTPFVPPRHLKPRGRNSLAGQVRAELTSRGLPDHVQVAIVDSRDDQEALRHRHFRRNRQNGPLPPVDCGFTLRLTFDQPVAGPLCLGYGSHYGLGMFKACS